jgi:hypothetical protein
MKNTKVLPKRRWTIGLQGLIPDDGTDLFCRPLSCVARDEYQKGEGHEGTREDHVELAEALLQVRQKAVRRQDLLHEVPDHLCAARTFFMLL